MIGDRLASNSKIVFTSEAFIKEIFIMLGFGSRNRYANYSF